MRQTTALLMTIALNAAVAGAAVAGAVPLWQATYDENAAIRRAFRATLDREPTASELRRYRVLMDEYRWSEADVLRALSGRSDYRRYARVRSLQPTEIVRRAYLDVPEPGAGRDRDEGLQAAGVARPLDRAGRRPSASQQRRVPEQEPVADPVASTRSHLMLIRLFQHAPISVRDQLLKVLGAPDTTGRCGRAAGAQTEERLEAGHRGPPPVVPKHELIEAGLELGAADPVVRADQPLLEVADRSSAERHYGLRAAMRIGSRGLRALDVIDAGLRQARKALQPVGVDRRARGYVPGEEPGDRHGRSAA